MMNEYEISNVKLSAKIPRNTCLDQLEELCTLRKIRTRRPKRCNLLVIHRKFTHIVFKSSIKFKQRLQHVNLTKVLLHEVEEAVDELAYLIEQDPSHILYSIDNITASGDLKQTLHLEDFIERNYQIESDITYQPEIFPGLFIKNEYGKTIIFRSGKYIIIGMYESYEI